MTMIDLDNRRVKRIHVNKHVIGSNRKHGRNDPPLTVKMSDNSNHKGHRVALYDDDGHLMAVVVHRPDRPLKCGAVVWIETNMRAKVGDDV